MEPEISQPEDDKAKSRSVSLTPTQWTKVDEKVRTKFGDNRSGYFQQLVAADLAGGLPTNTSSILVDLARKFHPAVAQELETLCFEADGTTPRIPQGKLLNRLLEATALALRAQMEAEKIMKTAPKRAIQAELARLRQLEDSFFQIAATISGYPEQLPDQDLTAAESKNPRKKPVGGQFGGATGPTLLPHDQDQPA